MTIEIRGHELYDYSMHDVIPSLNEEDRFHFVGKALLHEKVLTTSKIEFCHRFEALSSPTLIYVIAQ